jgi:hypothetical protein
MRRLAVPLFGLLVVACASNQPTRVSAPEPRIVTPATPELAKLSGRWVGRAETTPEVYWRGGFSGHAPALRVDVETVNDDGMQALIVMGEEWVRVFLDAKPSPQHGIYEGRHAAGPSLYGSCCV